MKRWAAPLLLLLLGLAQMTGDVLGLSALRGIAAATTASPAPKVFSAVDGFETYSTKFFVEWRDRDGRLHSKQLDSETYARLRGPYNRRNAYGAVVAYGPVLGSNPETRDLFFALARYALCGEAPLLREFGIEAVQDGSLRVWLEPREGVDVDLPLELRMDCGA